MTTPSILRGRSNSNRSCWNIISAIRRLKERYPDLQLTIATKTYGNLGNAPPVDPVSEADTLAKYFLQFYRLPATLVVEKRPHFFLSGLDGRRIDTESRNQANYVLRHTSLSGSQSVVVTDWDGRIIWNSILNRDIEVKLRRVFDVLLQRKP